MHKKKSELVSSPNESNRSLDEQQVLCWILPAVVNFRSEKCFDLVVVIEIDFAGFNSCFELVIRKVADYESVVISFDFTL